MPSFPDTPKGRERREKSLALRRAGYALAITSGLTNRDAGHVLTPQSWEKNREALLARPVGPSVRREVIPTRAVREAERTMRRANSGKPPDNYVPHNSFGTYVSVKVLYGPSGAHPHAKAKRTFSKRSGKWTPRKSIFIIAFPDVREPTYAEVAERVEAIVEREKDNYLQDEDGNPLVYMGFSTQSIRTVAEPTGRESRYVRTLEDEDDDDDGGDE